MTAAASTTRARALEVLSTGPLATVQDLGRPGLAALGVGRSGAADVGAYRLANRLLGNAETDAVIEVTLGGLAVRAHGGMFVTVTGAPAPATVDGVSMGHASVYWLPHGATLRLGPPASGLRSYLAVRGGLDVTPVLSSRSTDTLAGLGPDPLSPGHHIPVGPAPTIPPLVDLAPTRPPDGEALVLRVTPGPRDDWFSAEAMEALHASPWEVTAESDRVGMRLSGPVLERCREGELPSEGMALGALQVPPTGQPTLFLADHPVTGGYPVIAVVCEADVDLAAQARPGQRIRFARV